MAAENTANQDQGGSLVRERPVGLTLADLRTANEIRQREWDKAGGVDLSYRGNELAGETGEACNIIKKLERERLGIRGSRATLQQLAEELADVVICVDLIAMATGIDLGAAVVAKFNATSEKVGLATRLEAGVALRPVHLPAQAAELAGALKIAEDHLVRELEPGEVTATKIRSAFARLQRLVPVAHEDNVQAVEADHG